MPAEFTPLAQVLKARVVSSVSSAGHETTHFRPLGRTGAPPVSSGASPDPSAQNKSSESPHVAAHIELKREGDRISQIRITCRCGDLIEIDCEY